MSTWGNETPKDRDILLTLRREITYEGENYRWGFQIKDSEQRYQWFKLALDPSQPLTSGLASNYIDPLAYLPPYNAEKLSTDFMTAIRQHTERVLRKSILKSALRSTPVEYIVCS